MVVLPCVSSVRAALMCGSRLTAALAVCIRVVFDHLIIGRIMHLRSGELGSPRDRLCFVPSHQSQV